MSLNDSIYRMVHDYPGGSVALAPRLGMRREVLNSKVNPNCTTHHVMASELDQLMMLTADYRPLYAMAANHGHACIRLLDAPVSDLSVLESISTVWKEIGDVGTSVADALADGRVERREVEKLRRETQEAIQALLSLQHKLEGLQE